MNGTKVIPHHLRTLGERLRYRRRQMGWTQEQLAVQAGTNQAVIQKIENGKSLRPRKIDEIASVLDVNPAWLMFGDEKATPLTDEAREVAEIWMTLSEGERERMRSEIRTARRPPHVILRCELLQRRQHAQDRRPSDRPFPESRGGWDDRDPAGLAAATGDCDHCAAPPAARYATADPPACEKNRTPSLACRRVRADPAPPHSAAGRPASPPSDPSCA